MTNRHSLYLYKFYGKTTITCGRSSIQTKGIGVAMNSGTPYLFHDLSQGFSWLKPPKRSPESSRYERRKTAFTAGLARRWWVGDCACFESGSGGTCFLAHKSVGRLPEEDFRRFHE